MTHVFIVDDKTFKYHLEYMFAGTGGRYDAPFIEDKSYVNPQNSKDGIVAQSELSISGMIADVSRIRKDDKIIFYLQATTGVHDGMFFGVFKAVDEAFYDSNCDNYLSEKMGKNLNFRVCIKPDRVFAKGVSEYEALDLISDISHPSQMCWSLIYKKLKGNRGCTMITDFESESLIKKIEKANKNKLLNDRCFSFDSNLAEIVSAKQEKAYEGEQKTISIRDRMIVKHNKGLAFEAHLQAFILQNYDKNETLKALLLDNLEKLVWIGNEVSCGVGMQRIDIMTLQEDESTVYIGVNELKCIEPYPYIIETQLPRYVIWIQNYIVPLYPNKIVKIRPIVLAKKIVNDNALKDFKNSCSQFKVQNSANTVIMPVEYIAFEIGEDITFEKVF